MTARLDSSITRILRICAGGVVLACAVFAAGCEQEHHRTFYDFMDDSLAREGVLARCNQNRENNSDPECAEARRAAAAVAAQAERDRLAALEQESQRKIVALRDRLAADERAAEQAAAEVESALQAAYDAQWQEPSAAEQGSGAVASVESERGDSLSAFVPTRLPLEVAAVTPANDFEIDQPKVELAIIPRPFRHDDSLPH